MEHPKLKTVDFSCHAPKAKAVFVAGSFNDWRPDVTRLHSENGLWSGTLPLAPGHYEYKFVVDGQWCCEAGCEHAYQGCPKCVANDFGTMNRVLTVS
jgi:1,4-alpha-glucan branching enzyme